MSAEVLRKHCETALSVLHSRFETTVQLSHVASAGAIREHMIRSFLEEYLPRLVSVTSGQIFDKDNRQSRQQDVVLVLNAMPRIPFADGYELIFQDGVVAIVEIKTRLEAYVLKGIGENIGSVRALSSSVIASSTLTVTHQWPASRILTCIITYKGGSTNSLLTALGQLSSEQKPDLVLDLKSGLLVQNHGFLLQRTGSDEYIQVSDPAQGFMYFLTFLTEITGTLVSKGVGWRNYW